ncbi:MULTISPECIES: TetR/AcrR family transcriptional regulator [unclassified Achromobacter]|uniref:TetR/AcrR family transcriptional regulator n=1 Tax=unclassified Achromobacter TaxID=2626865 RepID=UPI0013033FE2|nr:MULTISPECIES: TetR/AcrR family transcriptional regulator [unclassified Achromobacter]
MTRASKPTDATPAHCLLLKTMFSRKKGRPSSAMAGDVEERILDAATTIFLERGFGQASLDAIAKAAGASKATLYSRYSGKEALFAEVVKRNCERSLRAAYEAPQSASLEQHLILLAETVAMRLLSDEVIGLIRMVIAEAPRFPALAQLTNEAGKSRTLDAVAKIMAEHSPRALEGAALAASRRQARIVAAQMLDAIIPPMILKALMGEDLAALRGNLRSQVKQTIGVFAAAGALDAFQ